MIEKATNHVHVKFDDYLSDETGHWFTCHCGENAETVAHTWDDGKINEEIGIVTYVCTDCGYQKVEAYEPEFVFTIDNMMEELQESPAMQILALALCGSVAIVLILLIVIIVLGSKNRKLKKKHIEE